MTDRFALRELNLAVSAAVGLLACVSMTPPAAAGEKPAGKYVTGDFHNHTTCTDGTLSLKKLVDKSVNAFGLDWFVQAGHGGTGSRNCTLAEDPFEPVPPALNLTVPPTIPNGGQAASDPTGGPNKTWLQTIGAAAIKGDFNGTKDAAGNVLTQNMWRWQMIQEFVYPTIEAESRRLGKPIFVGLETVVPGHEHGTTGIIDGQLPVKGAGNANGVAQFEYCFDRADGDKSRGAANQWDCSVLNSPNNGLLDAAARKIVIAPGAGSGTAGHVKTIESVKWMGQNYASTSYNLPAHLERAGAFNPNGNNGFDVNHLRDYNNAAPTVAFGFESMPGHQAEPNRGSYTTNAVGGGTYGGTGIYAAAIGGVWDALLGEGRNWFFFASSDYHNRGMFGPDQRESTADFFPGEYTKDYVMVRNRDDDKRTVSVTPQGIVDGLRTGNSYVVNGDLIDRLAFVACVADDDDRSNRSVERAAERAAARGTDVDKEGCASMGEKLVVRPGADIIVSIVVRDPQGTNNSPYAFPNPSLAQIGITQPLNAPVLDHIDVIGGKVTGYVDPSNTAAYVGLLGSPAATNPSAALIKTFNSANWTATADGTRKMTFRLKGVTASQYVRMRGTNLPPSTPFETDASGNPLLDFGSQGKIVCKNDPSIPATQSTGPLACPAHMTTVGGVKYSSLDVAGWADLWFYSNPIFVEVKGSTVVAGIK